MKTEYKRTKTTVSLINYHFVFCPRYRRKIFNIPGVEKRFKEITLSECEKIGIEVLALECHVDHVHIFVSVLPTMSIPEIMRSIKGMTSHKLRDEFPKLDKKLFCQYGRKCEFRNNKVVCQHTENEIVNRRWLYA